MTWRDRVIVVIEMMLPSAEFDAEAFEEALAEMLRKEFGTEAEVRVAVYPPKSGEPGT